MPMTFTDEMVLERGEEWGIPMGDRHSMQSYRNLIANETSKRIGDHVEAVEIKTGRPWNEWTEGDKLELLQRQLGGFV